MKPTANVLELVPSKSLDTTSYYLTCLGSNPAQGSLNSAAASIASLLNDTSRLQQDLCGGGGAGNATNSTSGNDDDDFVASNTDGKIASSCCSFALPAMATTLANANVAMESVNSAAGCGPFMDAWRDLVDPSSGSGGGGGDGGDDGSGGGSSSGSVSNDDDDDDDDDDASASKGLCTGTLEGLVRLWGALFGSALCIALYLALTPRAFAHLVADARQTKEQRGYEAGVHQRQEQERQHQQQQQHRRRAQSQRTTSTGGGGGRRSSAVGNPLMGGGGASSEPLLPPQSAGGAEYEDDMFFFGDTALPAGAAHSQGAGNDRAGLTEFFATEEQGGKSGGAQQRVAGGAVVLGVESNEKGSSKSGRPRSALL
jgi:hypothetical protein